MDGWMKEFLFTLAGAEFVVAGFLGTLGVGWIPIAILTTSASVGGLFTMNYIIDKKEEKQNRQEKYLKTIKRNTQYLEKSDEEAIEAEKIIPVSRYKTEKLVEDNPEKYEEVQHFITEITELKEQQSTTPNEEQAQYYKNLQTVYEFALQDTLKQNSKSLIKSYSKK